MATLKALVNEARKHRQVYQPRWYRSLINSRRRKAAVRDAADAVYRYLTQEKGSANEVSGPMTVDRWRRMKFEKKVQEESAELRRATPLGRDKVNTFSNVPLIEPAGGSAGEMRAFENGGSDLGDDYPGLHSLSCIEALNRSPGV